MKRALLVAAMIAVVIAVLSVAFAALFGIIGQPYQTWYGVGPIQILGGPDEAWLFVEKNIVAGRPGRGEHSVLRLACNQKVVVIASEGVRRRITIPELKEVTFHMNLTRIVRWEDGFYLLRCPSMGRHGSLFKWEENQFQLLPLGTRETFLKAHGLEHSNAPELDPALDRLTERNGWKHLCAEVDWILAPFEFIWNEQPFEIAVLRGPPTTKLLIRSLQQDNRWEASLLEFDPTPKEITFEEYHRLGRREPGYAK